MSAEDEPSGENRGHGPSPVFALVVPPAGVEPATWWVEATRSVQLSYGGEDTAIGCFRAWPVSHQASPCIVTVLGFGSMRRTAWWP